METQNWYQDWQEQILKMGWNDNYLMMGLDEFSLKDEQKKMLETMIYPSDSNPYLQHIDWTFGREPIQTIIDNGYYSKGDKEMLNNLREHWIRYTKR